MSQPRRKYDPEFKAGAVRIVRETRRPNSPVSPMPFVACARGIDFPGPIALERPLSLTPVTRPQ